MIITPPQNVISPQDMVSNVRVIYQGPNDSVSIAMIDWDSGPCIAMRWNSSSREQVDPQKISGQQTCVGMPTSHGIPVWFVLPNEMFDPNSDIAKALIKAGTELQKNPPA